MAPTRTHDAKLVAFALRLDPKTVKRYAAEGCPHRRDEHGKLWFTLWEVIDWMQDLGRTGEPGRPG